MASAAITLVQNPATIEVDTNNNAIMSKANNLSGVLVNGGSQTVFLNTAGAGASPATNNAQAQNVVGIPAGGSFKVLRFYTKISAIVPGTTSFLWWIPDE
jgi:hypothetical protein